MSETLEEVEGAAFALANALVLMGLVEVRLSHGAQRGQCSLLEPGIRDNGKAMELVRSVQVWLARLGRDDGGKSVGEKLEKFTHSPSGALCPEKGGRASHNTHYAKD
ncbi:MAG: hypothetical protein HPY85_06730 [Anaerolineae bacterium]|nr:hypothetical protein [Anaerolineae bacterium]